MAEPETKADLLKRIASEHKRLEQTLDRIPTAQLVQPDLDGGWAVKDVLAHLTWWERRMVQRVQRALQGHPQQPLVPPGEDWETELNRINMQVFNESQQRSVEEIIAERQSSYGQVIAMVEALPDDILANPSEVEAVLGQPLIPQIAGDTYEHYREHNDMISTWLDNMPAAPGSGVGDVPS